MEYPIKEKWFGDKLVVAELEDFKVLKFAPTGLLDEGQQMLCLYKKKPSQSEKEKKINNIWSTNAVFDRVQSYWKNFKRNKID